MSDSVDITVRQLLRHAYPYVRAADVREVTHRSIYVVPVALSADDTVWVLIPRVWAIGRRWNLRMRDDPDLALYAGMEALDHLGDHDLRVDLAAFTLPTRALSAGGAA